MLDKLERNCFEKWSTWEPRVTGKPSQNRKFICCWEGDSNFFWILQNWRIFYIWGYAKHLSKGAFIQSNLFQKNSFLNQLIYNMTTDCSFNYEFSTRNQQIPNMFCTKTVLDVKTKNNFCTQHVLNLQFSCTELIFQWIICRHIVDSLIQE